MKLFNKSVLKKSDKVLILESKEICLEFIDHFMGIYEGNLDDKIDWILNYNVWCYDLNIIEEVEKKWGLPKTFNLYDYDFILSDINEDFDYIFGYPYIDYDIPFKNDLHQMWGRYNGFKIPIEAWTIIKCLGIIQEKGILELGYYHDFVGRRYLGLEQLNLEKYKHGDIFYYKYQNK
jgi:hypothetical protein